VRFPSLSQEDPLKKEMATHSGILIGKIPWTEEPCGLEAVELQELDVKDFREPLDQVQENYHLDNIESS